VNAVSDRPEDRGARVLVLAPTARDAALVGAVLERAGITAVCCADLEALCEQLAQGAGAVLVAEEAIGADRRGRLAAWIAGQPAWSDLPVLVLARPGADSAVVAQALARLRHVTVLERPIRLTALLSAVASALRARRRQYETREHLARIERSEEDLRDFFDTVSVGIHWVGPDGRILRVNQHELDMLGYTREEYLGRAMAELHVDPAVPAELWRRLLAGEPVRNLESRLRRKDGAIRDVDISANGLWADGHFVHARSLTRDVTDRKLAGAAQAQLAAIVASSDDAIVSKTIDGTILTWNRGAERLFGHTAAEAVGRHISLIIPPERIAEEEAILGRLRAGQRVDHLETIRLRKDGTMVPVSLTISPLLDGAGRVVGASKIARDITVRKRSEAELRRQGQRQRLLWEAAAVLLTADDPDTMLKQLFEQLRPHLGVDCYLNYRPDERGESLWLASWQGIPDPAAAGLARLQLGESTCGRAAAAQRPIVATFMQQAPDPELAHEQALGIRSLVCHPLMVGRRLLGTLSFGSRTRDHLDADELEFVEIICRYVAAAYERLRLIEDLREADHRKDEFLAVLAHELRNPLAPIRSAIGVLRISGEHDPAVERMIGIMSRQVDHMVRLVDDLLEVSRITRGKIELRQEPVAVADVVRSAVETSRPLIDAAGHRLGLAIPPEPLTVAGDPMRLAQVVANLLNNAAKYTAPGGRIQVTVRCEAEQAAILVQDNGMGIPADMLPRVFDYFTQVGRQTDRTPGGLGIGLALVKRLVEMHGGSVTARSEGEGQGSEFEVRLPLLGQAQADAPGPDEPEVPDLHARRVLVVDDNRDAAQSLGLLLRLLGADVQVVFSGAEALAALPVHRPSVVLLDLGMPDMDGYEVARRIRAQADLAGLRLIALTGRGQPEDRRRSAAAGFDAHLVKPVDPAMLEALLASIGGPTAPAVGR
jgi:PAS domain S-box-containing protein